MWDKVMGLVFWISLVVVVYAYVGYALWLMVRGGKRPIRCAYQTPTVSILIAARNEEEINLPVKLENLRSLDYPAEKVQIVIASDGSTDRTAAILRDQPGNVFPVIFEQSVGKAAALNQAVRHATGEILVFLDARQRVDLNAVSELVSCLADPTVERSAESCIWKLRRGLRLGTPWVSIGRSKRPSAGWNRSRDRWSASPGPSTPYAGSFIRTFLRERSSTTSSSR